MLATSRSRLNGHPLFWKKDKLLIPANTVTLETVRAGHTTSIITNKSQDITGHLTLVDAYSKKYPSTQTWEANITNHSNKAQSYSIEQNTNGILTILEGDEASKTAANSLKLSGIIEKKKKKALVYKIKLNN